MGDFPRYRGPAGVIPRPGPEPGSADLSSKGEAGRGPLLVRLYPALGNSHFRLFWLGMLPAVLAFQMNNVAAPYAAFVLAGNATVLGLISLALGLPMMAFSLVGGVVADRFPRLAVLIATQSVLLAVAVALAALSLTGTLQVWHLLALSFLQGAAFAFNMPARQAYIAEIVGRPLLSSAVTINNAGMNFTRIAGPALAGALISVPAFGVWGVFATMSIMYVAVLASLVRLPANAPAPAPHGRAGGWEQLLEGLEYVRSSPALLSLLAMAFGATLFGMPVQTLMPVFAERVFQAGPGGLGALTAATGIGAFAGSLVVAALSKSPRPATLQLAAGIGFGLTLAGFAFSPTLHVGIAFLIALGFLSAAFMAINNTLVMSNTAPNLYGRVMSIYMLSFATMPLGALPLAWLADRAGAPIAVALSGLLLVITVVAIALIHPPARHNR